MKKRSRPLAGLLAAAMVFIALASASAETVTLKLKRLQPVDPAQVVSSADYRYRITRPQNFYMQLGAKPRTMMYLQAEAVPQATDRAADFAKVVTKQPAKYRAEHPLRAVARLGSGQYGLVVDCKDDKAKEYCRLYFDLNHNGDLTDDKVIEGKRQQGRFPTGFASYRFPRVDLTIDVDGTKVDYAFFFSVQTGPLGGGFYSYSAESEGAADSAKQPVSSYVMARLQAAAYREGELELGGETKRVVLLDYNSNGRFDDRVTMRQTPGGPIYPAYGDVFLVDPPPTDQGPIPGQFVFSTFDLTNNQVAKLIQLDGDLYDLKVSPAGDRLTLAPSAVPVGHVKIPCDGFSATVYGDLGFLKISGDKAQPISLPAGDWRLMSYTIDQTESWKAAQGKEAEKESKSTGQSLLGMLAGALTGSAQPAAARSRTTLIAASGSNDCKVLEVKAAETIPLPFGPPYKPVVKSSLSLRGGQQVQLGLSLVGAGGELCNQLMVDGKQPEQPEFTITAPDGEEVATGKFEWG